MTPVSYFENQTPKKGAKEMKNVEIHIEKGSNPEVFTEEHEKLLGDSKTPWTLYVDGYDQGGQRIYDSVWGKSCHQCRYGENVLEVNDNPDWICPVCRGICNCSRCRRVKGWAPTGQIYKKLGFKSVAHYLIQTFRSETKIDESTSKNLVSPDVSFSSGDNRDESSDAISIPAPDGNKRITEHKGRHFDSDNEYVAGDSDEDFVDADDE